MTKEGYMIDYIDSNSVNLAKLSLNDSESNLRRENERLHNFAHMVSHNLRSYSGNLSRLLTFFKQSNSEMERSELLDFIQKLSDSFSETVKDLDAVVSQEFADTKVRPLSLRTYALKVIETLSLDIKEKDILINNYIPSFTTVEFTPAYLESILLNLLTNAIKYRDPQKKCRITLSVGSSREFVILQIEDNGVGIDLERHGQKLFGMYQTFHGNSDAKGIGLFITRSQIESIGGKIKVDSKVREGTTFKIFFPRTARVHPTSMVSY